MLDSFASYFWQHPAAVIAAAIGIIIVLIWMTGSGSRQRFISFQRTKETDQLARDLSRIAAALERIARNQETPTDYVGRPIPPAWESTISAGEPAEEIPAAPVAGDGERTVPVGAPAAADQLEAPAAFAPPAPAPVRENSPGSFVNPLGGSGGLLGGKKKLDLPNPLYRPK
ncbi:MAG: hypothetical protein WA020_11525 [Candidatus Acidiferrales bacterium]